MCNNRQNTNNIGKSIYQKECKKYYSDLRQIHSKVFTNSQRINVEKTQDRYKNGNIAGIENLYTFINILVKLLNERKDIKGVDYGCGSHYFVDDMYKHYGWDVIGFDSDINAINDARRKYPKSADRYISLNLLQELIPLNDCSQDFVFSNAVIQHFSDDEVKYSFKDISRVLKPNGIFLLIFKRKIIKWKIFSIKTGLKLKVKDVKQGKIEIEDEEIKKALTRLDDNEKNKIRKKYFTGMRVLHFFHINKIVSIAKQHNLKVVSKIDIPNGKVSKGILTYQSGKGIPNAAIFFIKI